MRPHPAICPRCGYDLSGVVKSWSDACPLEGTCSECGLTLDWREVLRPELQEPKWFFEHPYRRRFVSLASTLWRACFPWRLWPIVGLSWPVRRARLLCLAVSVLLISHFAIAAGAAVCAYWGRPLWWGSGPSALQMAARAFLWPFNGRKFWRDSPALSEPAWAVVLAAMAMPLAYFALPQTLARVRVRKAHLLRAWAYSLGILLMSAIAIALDTIANCYFSNLPRHHVLHLITHPWLVAVLCTSDLVLYWYLFTRTYLRLPHAFAVTLAMIAIAVLVSVLVQVIRFWITLDTSSWLM